MDQTNSSDTLEDKSKKGDPESQEISANLGPKLVSCDTNPAPDNGKIIWVENGGVNLRCAYWQATEKPVKGTICLIQGRTEYIEKYFETIADLRRRGFAVLTFDFRGQGGSDRLLKQPMRGHVDEFSDYVSDLEKIASEVLLPECPAPFYALAHSMGGAVMLHSLNTGHLIFDRVVLTAPMVALNQTFPNQQTLQKIVRVLNGLGFGEMPMPFSDKSQTQSYSRESNGLTSDMERYEAALDTLAKAPVLRVGRPTIGWVHAACKAMAKFRDPSFGGANRTPIMIVSAGDEKIVSQLAIERLSNTMRSAWYLTIPGARHEILQERDGYRDQFWAAFDAFIPGTDVLEELSSPGSAKF